MKSEILVFIKPHIFLLLLLSFFLSLFMQLALCPEHKITFSTHENDRLLPGKCLLALLFEFEIQYADEERKGVSCSL